MGKVVGVLMIVLLAVLIIGLAQNYGWVVLFLPLGVIATLASPFVIWGAIDWQRSKKSIQATVMRRRISELEALQGLPLPTDGVCAACGSHLILGAKFCSFCKAEVRRTDRVCKACGTRNAAEAMWCGSCGKGLTESEAIDASAPLYPGSSAPATGAPL